jgi:hypothetical protein
MSAQPTARAVGDFLNHGKCAWEPDELARQHLTDGIVMSPSWPEREHDADLGRPEARGRPPTLRKTD